MSMAAASPESQVEPYEGLDERQRRMTGESLPKSIIEICDECHWCATCLNEKGAVGSCPVCGKQTSRIEMGIDEVCYFDEDDKGNVTLCFDRKLPMR